MYNSTFIPIGRSSNPRNKSKIGYKYNQVYCIVKHTHSMQYLVFWVTNATQDCVAILHMLKLCYEKLVASYEPWDRYSCNSFFAKKCSHICVDIFLYKNILWRVKDVKFRCQEYRYSLEMICNKFSLNAINKSSIVRPSSLVILVFKEHCWLLSVKNVYIELSIKGSEL